MTASVGLTVLLYLLPFGYYATAVTGDIVFSEQYKHNTLKNEVAYGLPRLRIYFGKLLASTLLALAACAVLVLWYGLLCGVLLPGDGAMLNAWRTVGFGLLTALPVWLGPSPSISCASSSSGAAQPRLWWGPESWPFWAKPFSSSICWSASGFPPWGRWCWCSRTCCSPPLWRV